MKIIKTSEALPKSGRYVLAWLEGAKIPMRAMWADQHTLPLGDDADPEWGEYSEEKDEYFCPAGWYEMNQFEEQHWGVSGNVVAWCELPRLDHQCLAQIEEPAQPIAGYRISDPSDPELGFWFSETPCAEGYTSEPLYAGAAPAAVAGPAWGEQQVHALAIQMAASAPPSHKPRDYDADMAWARSALGFIAGHAPAAHALEAPAAPMSTAEASAALAINSALHRIRAGNAAGAIEPLEQARAALAAAPQAPAAPVDRIQIDEDQFLIRYPKSQVIWGLGRGKDFIRWLDEFESNFVNAALRAAPAAPAVDALDAARLDWLEEQAKQSPTGISFDYVRHVEDGQVLEKGWRFMRRHFLGERKGTLRAAIDAAQAKEGGEA